MSEIITDSKGRKISVRKLNILDQVKVLRAVGAGQSGNQVYVQLVTMAFSVDAIDGVPMMVPQNEREIDAAISKIGDDGFASLVVHTQRQIDDVMAAAEAAANTGDGASGPLEQSA